MMNKPQRLIVLLLLSCFGLLLATPPLPPVGFRWVLNEQFSDEFDGTELDRNKWDNYFNGGWEGRHPAWFNPEAVSVEDGLLKIRSGVLPTAKGGYTMYGGAVSSTTRNAHYGYYECSAKASEIAMSTTFWMSGGKMAFDDTKCKNDSYSQELDIQECIGGGTVHDKFRNGMNSNTHFRYVKCDARREEFYSRGAGTILKSNVYDEYHTYAAWWKNPNEVYYYANDQLSDVVNVRTDIKADPFSEPMQLNMVTETYDWQPAPNDEDLENAEINTAYYDWVRSYKLVRINEKVESTHTVDLYNASLDIDAHFVDGNLILDYTYQANEDCHLSIEIKEKDGTVVQSKLKTAWRGYAYDNVKIPLTFKLKRGQEYVVLVNLKSQSSNKINIKKSKEKYLIGL